MYNPKKNFLDNESSQIPIRKLNANEHDKETGYKLTDYKIICELGRGSYGVVYRVVSLANGNEYVLKKINMKHVKLNHQKEALKEAQILKKVRHNNIIKYYTSFVEQDYLYIVMEYAESGDLATLIKSHKEKRKPFSEKQIWDFAWELCQALEYLHKNNIIHRDIKTLNIFLTRDGHIKLGDLGVSKIVSSAAALQGTRVGTPLYLSPELVKQLPYDFKVDIWALGCVLYHLAALEAPFIGENLITLGYNIVNKSPKPLSATYSTQLTSLIMKFLEKSPTARPKLSDVWKYFPSKYRISSNDNNHPSNSNKVEYHSNSAAQLLKIDEEIIISNKKEKPLTHWMSPEKKHSQIDLPTRPYTANHLNAPYSRDNISPEKSSSKGNLRPQVFPIKANLLSRNMSPSRYTPSMPISSVDEPRNRSPDLDKGSPNQRDKLRRISQKEASIEGDDISIEKAIVHRQSPTVEIVKVDNNQKFNSHGPIQRSQTADAHKILMNPLINSGSARIKVNNKPGQAPSLQGYFSKPGNDAMPYMFSRPQTAQLNNKRNVEEKAFNARDNEESGDDDESSDSLETLGDLRKKAYGMRIRPISANNLVTMQNQLVQSAENKVANKGLKSALSVSTIEKEPIPQMKIPESPKQDINKLQYGGASPRNRSLSIERPKSAIGVPAINGQLPKEQAAIGVKNPANPVYIKPGYGEMAFGKLGAQDAAEKDKEKVAKFFQTSKLEVSKAEVPAKENPEEKEAFKKLDYRDLLKKNVANASVRIEATGKSSIMKSSIDVSRRNESALESDVRYQAGITRPTTAASSKKRLTIHDLM